MTSKLQQVNDICLQCNGHHCNMAKTCEYKNCRRYKLLVPLYKSGQDILKVNDLNIDALAKYLLAQQKLGAVNPTAQQLNTALRTIDNWRSKYD